MAKYTDRTYPDALWMCIPAYYYSDIDHNNPVYVLIPWDYRTRALLKDAFYKLDTVIEKGGISEVSSLRVLDKISIYSMGALPFWDE